MVDELCAAFDRAEDDDDIWLVILTGAGPSFSAGGDLKAMRDKEGMFAGDSRTTTTTVLYLWWRPRRFICCT